VTAAIAILLFVALDVGLVIAGLAWLNRQRARADITDMRYRDYRRRYR
jgi:hypothetical protein